MTSTPTYRFTFNDLLTNNVLGEMTLSKCSASMDMESFGTFQGSFPLGTPQDALNLSITQPARTALYVQRNAEYIWGGIIWDRDYNSDTKQVELSAQVFDSFYDRTVLEKNFVKTDVDQGLILSNMISRVNGQDGGDIGITYSGPTTGGTIRTIAIPAYEFHYASEIFDLITDDNAGMEYTVVVAAGGTQDEPTKTLVAASVGSLNTSQVITLDYPGSIQKYTWPENGFQGGNKFAGRGGGTGSQAPTAVYHWLASRAAGYPSLWATYEYPDIVKKKHLKTKVARKKQTDRVPITSPTFDVNGDLLVGNWQDLGATIAFNISDVRFPAGLSATRRMYGWEMTFADEDNAESVTILTDNGDTA